ncbi:MAG: hypothetical protein II569_04870, partial [Paludibacteraceae bacterium]|nr:hypothetical protein [Paludibacteraceae bacterium]
MKYYSTNGKAAQATLEEAVVKGLASDKGLFMPEKIKALPKEFFDNTPLICIHFYYLQMSFHIYKCCHVLMNDEFLFHLIHQEGG